MLQKDIVRNASLRREFRHRGGDENVIEQRLALGNVVDVILEDARVEMV